MRKTILLSLLLASGAAFAQPGPRWGFDDRYHHHHYYPAVGYAVPALPAGYLAVAYGGAHLYFHAGVWYRPAGATFVVVQPPVGVVVPVLPPSYTVVYAAGVPYYYANNTYYSTGPGGAGYAVVAPPPGAELATAQPAPPPVSSTPGQASGSAPASAAMWHYCESAKAYYPYVTECKEGWRQVPATPPH